MFNWLNKCTYPDSPTDYSILFPKTQGQLSLQRLQTPMRHHEKKTISFHKYYVTLQTVIQLKIHTSWIFLHIIKHLQPTCCPNLPPFKLFYFVMLERQSLIVHSWSSEPMNIFELQGSGKVSVGGYSKTRPAFVKTYAKTEYEKGKGTLSPNHTGTSWE